MFTGMDGNLHRCRYPDTKFVGVVDFAIWTVAESRSAPALYAMKVYESAAK